MARFVRGGIAVVFPSRRVLTHSLPVRPASEEPRLDRIKNVVFDDPHTGTRYVLNYSGYYVMSPASFEKTIVPPPPRPYRFDLPDESEEPRYLFDLLPCPVALQPMIGLRVCVESHLKSAVFLHPDRAEPTDLDRAVRLVSWGSIDLPEAAAPDYVWEGWIEVPPPPRGVISRLTGSGKPRLRFRDASGEHDAGPWNP